MAPTLLCCETNRTIETRAHNFSIFMIQYGVRFIVFPNQYGRRDAAHNFNILILEYGAHLIALRNQYGHRDAFS